MDSLFNSDVNAGKKAPKFKVFVILLVSFLVLISISTFIFFKPSILNLINKISGGQDTQETPTEYSPFTNMMSPVSESSREEKNKKPLREGQLLGDIVRKSELKYQDGSSLVSYYIYLISTGDVYKKNVVLDNGQTANLFILKALILNNDEPIEAVIAVSVENTTEEIGNWWVANFSSSQEQISELLSLPLDEERFEKIFLKDTEWKYTFYPSYDMGAPDWYVSIAKVIYEGFGPDKIISDITNEEKTNLILMPQLVIRRD